MIRSVSVASLLCLLATACGGAPAPAAATPEAPAVAPPASSSAEAPAPEAPASPEGQPLTISLEARSGSKLTGTATFTPVEGGVRVKVSVAGVTPGKLATHVHEKGDCSAPDATSAGSHFNPGGHQHGLPGAAERHLGDLGNIEVAADGTGSTELTVEGAALTEGGASSFLGKAIIVHEKVDDGGQPVGNAGGRIGCGVIRR